MAAWSRATAGVAPTLEQRADLLLAGAHAAATAASVTEMMPTTDWYGLGIGNDWNISGVVGHGGSDTDGNALAGCLPESGVAFAVLANGGTDAADTRLIAAFLMQAAKQP